MPPPSLLSTAVYLGGVRGAPTEGSGGQVWRGAAGPGANFTIRNIVFGLMVLENLLQVLPLNKHL